MLPNKEHHPAVDFGALRRDLEEALARKEFHLVYQPLLCPETNRVVGGEALLRWKHPRWGELSPRVFLAVAETIGMTFPLTHAILRSVCGQGRTWLDAGLPPLRLSANITPAQLCSTSLPDLVGRVLDETGFPAENLNIEVAETSLRKGSRDMAPVLAGLGDMGIGILVDDFGEHDLSLGLLDHPGITGLKMSSSLTAGREQDAHAHAVVHAVKAYTGERGFFLGAKGIETDDQFHFAQDHGVGHMQGFRISRPLEAEAFSLWCAECRHPAAGLPV